MPRVIGLPTQWATKDGEIIDLSLCPEGPTGLERTFDFWPHTPVDPDREAKVLAWEAWGREVIRYRHGRWLACEGQIPYLDAQKEQARERFLIEQAGPAYFITVWMSSHEAREENLEAHPWRNFAHNGWLPSVLYPYQYELIEWIEARANARGAGSNGAVSKSRDMGVTMVLCYVAAYRFLFTSPFSAKLVSRKEDLVDDIGNLDSMMERIASMIFPKEGNAFLPNWLVPAGLHSGHRRHLKITRPDLPNTINGESTTSRTGRGGRSTWIYLDEAAFIEELGAVLTSVQATTGHVFCFSSESVRFGEAFIIWRNRLRERAPEAVLELDCWLHPYHNADWVEEQWERYIADDKRHGFFNEIARDPYAGFGGWMYDYARDNEADLMVPDIEPELLPDLGQMYCAIDPGQKDETCLTWIFRDIQQGRDVVLRSYEASGLPPEYYAAIIAGCDPDLMESQYRFRFSQRARELIEWVQSVPQPRMVFGDPYGATGHFEKDDTFYSRMAAFWKKHNPHQHEGTERGRVIPIGINWKPDAREYQGRRNALHMWLRTRLKFADTPSARRSLTSLQQSRWEEDEKRVAEQKVARHDEWSHQRTALEFAAVNMDAVPKSPAERDAKRKSYTVRDADKTPRRKALSTNSRRQAMATKSVPELSKY